MARFLMAVQWTRFYFVAGALFCLSFYAAPNWWWALCGMAAFFQAVTEARTLRQHLIGGYLTTVLLTGGAVGIFFSLYPLEWVETDLGLWEFGIVFAKWAVTSLLLATSGVVIGFLTYLLRRFVVHPWQPLGYPLVWVSGEVFCSFFYSLVVLGEGVTANTYNTAGYIGYALIDHALLKFGALSGGVYTLSVLVVLLGYGLWWLIGHQKYCALAGTIGILWVTAFIPFQDLFKIPDTVPLSVAIIDTRFTTTEANTEAEDFAAYRAAQLREAMDAALATGADYVLLPEDSRLMGVSDADEAYKLFRFFYGDPTAIVIDSARTELTAIGKDAARAFIYDGQAKRGYAVDKQYLAPLGEYLPYSYKMILEWLGLGEAVASLDDLLSYVPGPRGDQAVLPEYVPAVVFCFEMAAPLWVRSFVTERSVPFVAYTMSHARFHDSALLILHTERMIKTQAIYNRIPVVAAGNMVAGAYFTETGEKVIPERVATGERWSVGVVMVSPK